MKQSVCVLFIFVCFVGTQAAPPALPLPLPELPKAKCIVEGLSLNDGESVPAPAGGICSLLGCYVKYGVPQVSRLGCGLVHNPNPKCVPVLEDNTKLYPACCAHYECKDKTDKSCTKDICA